MHAPTIKRAGWATIILLVQLVGCQKSINVVTATSQDCQLQSEFTLYNSGQHTTTTYTYNGKSQLITGVTSTSYPGSAPGPSSFTNTYSYDPTGNLITSTIEGTSSNPNLGINSTTTFEYTGGRLTKQVANSSTSFLTSYSYTYSYDGLGQIATYSYSTSEPTAARQSYSFTSGVLTSGTITSSGQSTTLIVANGRVEGSVSGDDKTTHDTYDAKGYLLRSDSFDKAGTLQSYITHEYNSTGYKRGSFNQFPAVLPTTTLNLYGKTDLPSTRDAVYNADGSLNAETNYQYQVNSKGYITSLSYEQNQPGVGGQPTSSTTYTYSNCP